MTEKQIQRMVATYFKQLEAAIQTFTFFAVPGGSVRIPVHIAKQLKDSGVRAGVSDLVFLGEGGKTVLIELKALSGSLSDAQKQFFAITKKLGHAIVKITAADGQDAIRQIECVLRGHGFRV